MFLIFKQFFAQIPYIFQEKYKHTKDFFEKDASTSKEWRPGEGVTTSETLDKRVFHLFLLVERGGRDLEL